MNCGCNRPRAFLHIIGFSEHNARAEHGAMPETARGRSDHFADEIMTKRALDISLALAGLICLSPLFPVIAALVKLDSEGPVFFTQERMGRGFRPFRMYKFRTMIRDAAQRGMPITSGRDPRITRIGHILRSTKIDELPQLINVLRGDMSVVGPRPELRQYVESFREDYADILKVRPGMTDLASLKYRDEATLLGGYENPEEIYVKSILPDKLALGKQYAREASLAFDLSVIVKTLAALMGRRDSC
jgi:lipopolysaccharide/colanic/teichoic acid biosynthesis glycosyltransferase